MTVIDDDKFLSQEVRKKVRKTWQHRYVVANKIASHLVGAIIIILGMEILELLLKFLKIGDAFEGLPFAFPFRWIMNASDVAILIGFLGRGVYEAWKAEGEE
ncbi:hypothetical protein [Bradyrhizobium commune]|uniref:Uncharacterized protein n=1 Tax=Bradyrhizobium commune TaxID=83627 RepID=A0A7S9CZX6_9BRAD|nr:hypothetical protein [Bradyrhizobium commune]QPF88610.1 hypothetical protein IC761_18900 [Bradyrhizobium commune]